MGLNYPSILYKYSFSEIFKHWEVKASLELTSPQLISDFIYMMFYFDEFESFNNDLLTIYRFI